MYCKIFSVYVLLLLVCCGLYKQKCVAQGALLQDNSNENTISEFLKEGKIENVLDFAGDEEETSGITVKNIESVFFVAADSFIVALAKVSENAAEDVKINLFAKFFSTKEDKWGVEAVKKNENNWKKQLAAKNVEKIKSDKIKKSFAVVAKKKQDILYYCEQHAF